MQLSQCQARDGLQREASRSPTQEKAGWCKIKPTQRCACIFFFQGVGGCLNSVFEFSAQNLGGLPCPVREPRSNLDQGAVPQVFRSCFLAACLSKLLVFFGEGVQGNQKRTIWKGPMRLLRVPNFFRRDSGAKQFLAAFRNQSSLRNHKLNLYGTEVEARTDRVPGFTRNSRKDMG